MSVEVGDIGLDFVPSPSDGAEMVDVAGGAILVAHGGAHLHLLNSTATLVWSCIDGRSTVRTLVDDLAGALGLSPDTVAADVLALLRALWAEGVLAGSEGDAEPDHPDAIDPRYVMEPPGG